MAHLIPRPRLEQVLDRGAPVTVLRGASGSGKTSLLTQWAARQPAPVWIRVVGSTASRPAFWRAVFLRLAEEPYLEPAAIEALETVRAALEESGDVRSLLRDAVERLTLPLILIVDDGERIADAAVFDDLAAMAAASAHLRIVVASRVRTRLESAPVRVRVDVAVITPAVLRFTESETEAATVTAGLSRTGAREIHRGAGGSPMLTRAILLALVEAAAAPGAERDPHVIALHLLDELVTESGLPEAVREWAVRVSVVDELTPALAELLVPGGDHSASFDRLELAGFGVWNESGTRFQLTTAVREVFRARLADTPELGRALRVVAARWALAEGDALAALESALEADDLALASSVALQHWPDLVALHHSRVIALVTAVPMTELRRWPLLSMLVALAYHSTGVNRVRAAQFFTLSVEGSRAQRDGAAPSEQMLLSALENAALRVTGRVDAAVRAADRSEDLYATLATDTAFDDLRRTVVLARKHNAVTFGVAGRTEKALEVLASIDATGMPQVSVLTVAAAIRAQSGELDHARSLLADARTIPWPTGWTESYNAAQYRVARAVLAMEEFEFAAADAHLAALDAHYDNIEHWPTIVRLRTGIDLAVGEAERAERRLHEATPRRALIGRHERAELDAVQGDVLAMLGRGRAADRLLTAHGRTPVTLLARARVALVADDPHAALGLLRTLDRPGRLSPRLRAQLYLGRAAAATRLGLGTPAQRDSDAAVQLLLATGMRLPLLSLPPADRDVMIARIVAQAPAFSWPADLTVAPVGDVTSDGGGLTERELVVLRAASGGESLSAVSERLHVSLHTVKSQLGSVYRKLGVRSRREAIAEAVVRELL